MRRTLQDVASYLKEILVPETDEAYAVDPALAHVAPPEDIREGVRAFRAFLCRVYHVLSAEGGAYDTSKKVAHAYENRISLSVYYPFLHGVGALLTRMGYDGVPAEDSRALLCGGGIFSDKLSTAKSLECLRFLAQCGLRVDGIDMDDKGQRLADIQALRITYPDGPAMLVGMKALAIAEIDHRSLVCKDVLLRCDYRALKRDETDADAIVRDTLRPLPADVRDFAMQLHRRYLDKGLACIVEIKGFHIYIRYCYRRKDVWGLNASLSNGYHINVKATRMDEYADVIETLAMPLRDLIAKGYGCGRKREAGRCDGGCRGMPIVLDATALDMRDDIVRWLDREVACLQGK